MSKNLEGFLEIIENRIMYLVRIHAIILIKIALKNLPH
jgi:hypothetical protein